MRKGTGRVGAPSTFFPKISGEWYGVMLSAGQPVKLLGNLASKALRRPDIFTRAGRKSKNDQDQP